MTSTSALTAPRPLSRLHDSVGIKHEDLGRVRWIAVIGLVVLNVADLVLTRRLLTMGAMEANPIMAPFIGGPLGIVIKLALPVALGFRHLRVPVRRSLVLGLCWMCVLYLGVVSWNSQLFSSPHLIGGVGA